MQPPQTSASERYRRAIECLMGGDDPLTDMTEQEKDGVLGIINQLEVANDTERKGILDKTFKEREADREEFHVIETERADAFFEALRTEIQDVWDEKIALAARAPK